MLLDTAAPLSFPEKRAPTAIVCRGQSCALHAGRHGSRRPSQAWQVFGGRQGRHAYSIPDGAAKASDFCRSRHIVSSLRARDDAVVAMLAAMRWMPSKHSLGWRAFKSKVKSARHVVRLQHVRALGTFVRGCVALHVAGDAIYSAIKDRRSCEFVEVDG